MPEIEPMSDVQRACKAEEYRKEYRRIVNVMVLIGGMIDLKGKKLLDHLKMVKERGKDIGDSEMAVQDAQTLRDFYYEMAWTVREISMEQMATSSREARFAENERIFVTQFFERSQHPLPELMEARRRLEQERDVIERKLDRLGHPIEMGQLAA